MALESSKPMYKFSTFFFVYIETSLHLRFVSSAVLASVKSFVNLLTGAQLATAWPGVGTAEESKYV